MRVFNLLAAFALLGCSAVDAAPQRSIAIREFQATASASGLSSLKRFNDKYDTDYIAPGRSLASMKIRYRVAGEAEWKEISAATSPGGLNSFSNSNAVATYEIGSLAPTIASTSKASASVRFSSLSLLSDQIIPRDSHQTGVPFFLWWGRKGTHEWVQYDFARAQSVSSTEVYWALSDDPDTPIALPARWHVLYREGNSWQEVRSAAEHPAIADKFDRVDFAPVTTNALRIEVDLAAGATAGMFEWRVNDQARKVTVPEDLTATTSFHFTDDSIIWTLALRNNTNHALEIGDLAPALPFNTDYTWDKAETYTKRLIRHSFVGEYGSFVFWMRANSEGPYLVMTPQPGTALEYFDSSPDERIYNVYIHSAAAAQELRAKGGNWRLPNTHLILQPKGAARDSAIYGFTFHWAADYNGVRQVLYDNGGFDVNVVPGMTLPTDLPAMFSLRTRNKISSVIAEHPDETKIDYAGERGPDLHLYRVRFSQRGENLLKVNYGNGRYLTLEFFVTEPLETLIQKRSAFIVTHEQHRDPSKWYNGLFSEWDMKHRILRSPDDLDGLQSYAVACDDPILGKAMYVAAKNAVFPSQNEISAVEYYIQHYVWGGLQQTDKEPYPYAIYGIPNWKVNRDSPKDDPSGRKHLWRIYDYPHVFLMYYEMYRVAKLYPGMTRYLDAEGYLERAAGTAKAFFTVPYELIKWSPDETGTYDELVLPDLITALEENGHKDQADWLRSAWEKKVEYFINKHPDLYASEYPFDSTGFESTQAIAKYAMSHVLGPGEALPSDPTPDDFQRSVSYQDARAFLDEQMNLNVACRGWLETAYYDLGSDFRASGNTSYTLSYMAQMGGWAVSDYALYFARDPIPYVRLGYASYLSSWAILNSGTPSSNYGYWYPGKENDGAASGGFEPRPWGRAWLGNKEMGRGPWWYDGEIDLGFSGALRSAATVVVDDPIFGLYAYGGTLERDGNNTRVIPRDGLRTRFHILRGNQRFHMLFDRDGLAKEHPITFDNSLATISFEIENRAGTVHQTGIDLSGLPDGTYRVVTAGRVLSTFTSVSGGTQSIDVPVSAPVVAASISRAEDATR